MRLTNQTQYAIRMLMFCAKKDGLTTTKEIAHFFDLPEKFMLKVLYTLGKTGLIETVRGRGGGFRLAKPANEIRLGHVVHAIENDFELAECFASDAPDCPLVTSCGLNAALSKALAAFFEVLDEYTIEDLSSKAYVINVLMKLNEAQKLPLDADTASIQ